MNADTINSIKDITITAIKTSDAYDASIARLQALFAGKTDALVRSTLLPIVAGHYGLSIGKAKAGPTAGQLAFVLGDKPTDADKTKRNTAQVKLGRLVNAICTVSEPETTKQKNAREFKQALAAAKKLSPAAALALVEALGFKVKK